MNNTHYPRQHPQLQELPGLISAQPPSPRRTGIGIKGEGFLTLAVISILASTIIAFAGEKGPAKAQGENMPTGLERALFQWRQGDKAGAVAQFLLTDFRAGSTLSSKSPLNARENELSTMAAADREQLVAEAMTLLKDLKLLANAVKEKGANVAGTDRQLAQHCFAKLDQCGAALDTPGSLKILQLTAQGLRKMSAMESAKLKAK